MSNSSETAESQPPIPAHHPNEWPRVPRNLPNDVSVREFVETVISMNDRRYAEVNVEKEKALKIKETADLAALQLAREIQTYKDEKANELRSQIERERGNYATRNDLSSLSERIDTAMKPITAFVTAQTATSNNTSEVAKSASNALNNRLIAMGVTVSIIVVIVNVLFFVLAGH